MDLCDLVRTVRGMHNRPARRRRGIALVATASMSMIAAVAVMVIVTLSIDATRSESAGEDRSGAIAAAQSAQVEIEEALATAPMFFYSYVHALERARICTEDGDQIVEPGENWPAVCGTSWDYQKAAVGGSVRVEITGPNLDDPRLAVRILAREGRSEHGFDLRYAPDSTARWSLYDSGDLDLSTLPGGTNTLGGEIYAGGVIELGDRLDSMLSGMFVAEGGYTTHPDDAPVGANDVRFYAGTADPSGGIRIADARNIHQSPVNLVGAQAMFAAAGDVACPGTEPVLVGSVANHFCLEVGGSIVAADGTIVAVPEDARSYLLVFSVGGPDRVNVYVSNKISAAPVTCGGGCDLFTQSSGAISAGTHPGAASYWTLLADAALPNDGVIHTDKDVHIGLCGSDFVNVGGSCTDWDGSGSMRIERNVNVIAGGLLQPADVYASGPIAVADGVSFGAVAARDVVFPYWARVRTGDLLIAGSWTGLGLGSTNHSVRTLPAIVSGNSNQGGTLALDGGVAGVDIDLRFSLFDSVSITGRGRHWTSPPPLYPAHNGGWVNVQRRTIGGVEVCASAVCDSF